MCRAGFLAGQPDRRSFEQQRAKGERLGVTPVVRAAGSKISRRRSSSMRFTFGRTWKPSGTRVRPSTIWRKHLRR